MGWQRTPEVSTHIRSLLPLEGTSSVGRLSYLGKREGISGSTGSRLPRPLTSGLCRQGRIVPRDPGRGRAWLPRAPLPSLPTDGLRSALVAERRVACRVGRGKGTRRTMRAAWVVSWRHGTMTEAHLARSMSEVPSRVYTQDRDSYPRRGVGALLTGETCWWEWVPVRNAAPCVHMGRPFWRQPVLRGPLCLNSRLVCTRGTRFQTEGRQEGRQPAERAPTAVLP